MKLTGKRAQCTACGEVFSTDSNFEKHRKGRHGIDRHCVHPSTVGLVCKDGIWRGPGRFASIESDSREDM